MSVSTPRIGVLALQGDVIEHQRMLRHLGAEVVEVRLPSQLEGLDGLVLPGGESTTIGKLMVEYGILDPLRAKLEKGLPAYGTCAGLILLANDLGGMQQPVLGVMNIRVKRNAFGSQVDSFEQNLNVVGLEGGPLHAVFIRAPVIERLGAGVQSLATLPDGTVVAAQQGSLLVSSFHPELGEDPRMHALFLQICAAATPLRT
jgi:5'-phosphate synthase pdxT subunit